LRGVIGNNFIYNRFNLTCSGGDTLVEKFITGLPVKEMSFILISMGIILILSFFIDFVEISLIIAYLLPHHPLPWY